MYVYPSIGPDEWPGPCGPIHSKILINFASAQCSGSKALVNVKMFEIANQSVEGGIWS